MRLIQIIAVFFALAAFAGALVVPVTTADITGDGSVHQFVASGSARWVLLQTPSGNVSPVRWGDRNTTSSRGGLLVAGSSFFFPPIPVDLQQPVQSNNYYDLSAIYYYVAASDHLTVIYAQ